MNGKQLKNSILQWAIQGKLVPQDPNDEPASVLLERIRAEKARLVKEKKIKKDKNESIIYRGDDNSYYEKFLATGEVKCIDEEIPFEIPRGWEWCRFGSLSFNRDSERIPLSVSERLKLNKKFDYYGASGVIDKVDRFLFDKPLLLIGEDGANLVNRSTPIAFIARGKYWVNNHAHVIDFYSDVLMEYICNYINAISLIDYVTGTAQPKMNQEKMNSILVALPPNEEQTRINQKIESILPLVYKYDKQKKSLDNLNNELYHTLHKSILQEAIQGRLVPQLLEEGTAQELLEQIRLEKQQLIKEGKLKKSALTDSVIYKSDDNKYWEKNGKTVIDVTDEIPFDIPITWQWVRIKDIFQINPKNIAEDNCISAFIPMEKICATYGSKFSYDEVQWKTIKTGYTHFADGDVAFAKITPCFQNRKSAIFYNLPNGIGAGTTELKVLRQFGETINRWYLLIFLESPYFIDEAIFKGTANQQRIISGYLENKLFPLPPLQEQNRIEKQIKAIASIGRRMVKQS